ncbi:MAG: M81 family metallopeptidase [Rhodobacteraceae bacterium]|nr:M81 family metallopeptidase [Paracoccaceae bacterium]
MSGLRIALGGLQHETNSFAPGTASLADFEAPRGWPPLSRGAGMLAALEGTPVAARGALEVARAAGAEVVPLLWGLALPSGPVEHDAFETLRDEISGALRAAAPLDGVYLDLHGAMMTTAEGDAEGALLEAVRACVGPGVPVVISLDLHANVSPGMVAVVDGMTAYRTYPHIDMADAGARAMRRLLALAGGAPRRHLVLRQPGYLIPLVAQATAAAPVSGLYAKAAAQEAGQGGAVTIALGFPLADTEDAGPALVVEHEDDAIAEAMADAALRAWEDARQDFSARLLEPEEAVAEAMALPPGPGPVVIADVQDNPGGGGTNDTTGLLRALLNARADGALMVHVADEVALEAALAAGERGIMRESLGGRADPETGAPLPGPWRVDVLADGNFTGEGPMYGGTSIRMGPVALVSQEGVGVILAGGRMQASEPGLLRHLGIDPAEVPILAVKSSVHFRAAYEPMARAVLLARAPGRVEMDLARLELTRARRRGSFAGVAADPLASGEDHAERSSIKSSSIHTE